MKRVLKWIGIGLGTLAVLALLGISILYFRGGAHVDAAPEVPVETVADAAPDSATLAWGAHLVQIHACQECHGQNFAGQVLVDGPPFRVVATNLTGGQGGIGGNYTTQQWERAIRHGVRPDGRGLVIMPSDLYAHLSDDDLSAMVAYLKTLPAVDHALPKTEVKALGRVIAGMGESLLISDLVDHTRPHVKQAPAFGPTAEYGAYRASTLCIACHGANLQGAPHPDPSGPWAPSLSAAKGWGYDGFAQTMRTGVTPDGRQLDEHWMPWPYFRHMTDEELQALYRHIASLSFEEGAPMTAASSS